MVELSPIVTIGGKAVDRIKGRRGIRIHVIRMGAEGPVQIQPDQCAALFIIAREHDMVIVYAVPPQLFTQHAVLCGFSAAVDSLKNDQFSAFQA